jgi:hypothetical protein
MLSFEPKYFQRVPDGELAGSWMPTFPPAGAKTDIHLIERFREGERIQAEGGSIAIIDPMGDSSMLKRLYESINLQGRSSEVLVLDFSK